MAKGDTQLREKIADILRDWTPSEVLDAFAAEAAYWKRRDGKPEERAAWSTLRKMLLKTSAIAKDIGL